VASTFDISHACQPGEVAACIGKRHFVPRSGFCLVYEDHPAAPGHRPTNIANYARHTSFTLDVSGAQLGDTRVDATNTFVLDVMAVHWFDHHGLIEWRDAAAEARYKLATTGREDILDTLVMLVGDQRVAH
jgi:hypothetical protein